MRFEIEKPWLIILVVVIVLLVGGYTISSIKLPGGGEIVFRAPRGGTESTHIDIPTPNKTSHAPQITQATERIELHDNSIFIYQDIYFKDQDGDAQAVVYELLETTLQGVHIKDDPIVSSSEDQKDGTFVPAEWNCEVSGYYVILKATIIDAAGNRSNSINIKFDCNQSSIN